RHAHDPSLHSFPTRRSSDLLSGPFVGTASIARERAFGGIPRWSSHALPLPTTGPGSTLGAVGGGAIDAFARCPGASVEDAPPMKDRKSTRLNSSHVSISYAV